MATTKVADKVSASDRVAKETMYGVVPVLTRKRQYGMVDLAFVTAAFGIATWCYVQGGTLAGMINLPQAIASTFGAMIGTGIVVCAVGLIAARYGVDHWIYQRAVFGMNGVVIIAVLTLVGNWGWYAVNAQLYGGSVTKIAGALGLNLSDSWIKPMAISCIFFGWLIAMTGPLGVKWATRIMAPALLLVGVVVTVLIFTKSSWSELFAANPVGSDQHSGDQLAYMLSVEWNIAFMMSWFPVVGGLTRLAKTERAANWATLFGYGWVVSWFIIIATMTALLVAPRTGELSFDPTDWLLTLGGPVFGIISLIFIAVANITTMAVGAYCLSMGLKVIKPTWNFRVVATVGCLWTVLLTSWGGVWDYYPTFLAITGVVMGPALVLIIVDYYVLRRQKFSVKSLFKKDGPYRYWHGLNWPSLVSFALGAVAYFLVYDPINFTARSPVFLYTTATGLAMLVSGIAYLAFIAVPSVRRYLLRDAETTAVVGPHGQAWQEGAGAPAGEGVAASTSEPAS